MKPIPEKVKVKDKEYPRLRIAFTLRKELRERLGWDENTELEVLDHKDGVLVREKRD